MRAMVSCASAGNHAGNPASAASSAGARTCAVPAGAETAGGGACSGPGDFTVRGHSSQPTQTNAAITQTQGLRRCRRMALSVAMLRAPYSNRSQRGVDAVVAATRNLFFAFAPDPPLRHALARETARLHEQWGGRRTQEAKLHM